MVNHKRVYRLYREEGLRIRPKRPRRHVSHQRRELRTVAARRDERWSMDFMSDELFDERRIRVLTVVDHFTRECPPLVVDGSITGQRVVSMLAELALRGRVPRTIAVDNAREKVERWRRYYNAERPHGALGDRSPQEFALASIPAG